ncbi:MAG: Crp/Fnr family transcriptional regulator [Breznakia sp.]
MNIEKTLQSIPFCQHLSAKTRSFLLPYITIKDFKKGEHVFNDRDFTKEIFLLLQGVTYAYKISLHEEKRILFIHRLFDIVNIETLDERYASSNCVCLRDVQMLCIEKEKFIQALSIDIKFNKAIMDEMSKTIRRLYHQSKNAVNMLKVEKKLAAKLWKLAKDFGMETTHGTMIPFPLSITFLAELVGSKRETISRIMKQFTILKLINVHKKQIIILDTHKLLEYIQTP